MPTFLLGGGSNLLVSDEGFRGLVIRSACEVIEFDGTAVHVGCGADFLDLIFKCRDRGLAGLEFAAGIPGSVGGALYGNAGCYGKDIRSFRPRTQHLLVGDCPPLERILHARGRRPHARQGHGSSEAQP